MYVTSTLYDRGALYDATVTYQKLGTFFMTYGFSDERCCCWVNTTATAPTVFFGLTRRQVLSTTYVKWIMQLPCNMFFNSKLHSRVHSGALKMHDAKLSPMKKRCDHLFWSQWTSIWHWVNLRSVTSWYAIHQRIKGSRPTFMPFGVYCHSWWVT